MNQSRISYFSVSKENPSPNVLEALKKMTSLEKFTPKICDDLHWVLTQLHNFDHANGGHHTEQILIEPKNKKHWEMMKDFQYDDFWKKDN